jgi:steroid 5-alpha reductase family enzyme
MIAAIRHEPVSQGRVCRPVLWRHSRYPDYSFVWLHGWACVPFGRATRYAWMTLPGPVLVLALLLGVAGVPPSEERALASRSDGFRRDQRTPHRLFLGPPQRARWETVS